jgi:hypothetical protein
MKNIGLCSAFGLLITFGYLHGSVIAPQSLLDLEQTADLIVVGRATGISQQNTSASFSLLVSRVLKGDASFAGGSVSVAWIGASPGAAQGVGAGGGGLWFLQAAPTGWALLPVVQGNVGLAMTYFPAQPGAILNAYAYASGASLSDKVAAEVSSAIESNAGAYNLQLGAQQNGLLDQLNSQYSQVLYGRLSASASASQQIIGISGLIRGGSFSALTSAIQIASASPATAPRNGLLLLSIRDYFRATDLPSIAAIGGIATNSTNANPALREALAHVMAAVHTAATLPYLATLLNDPDANLRVEAVGGIGAFANGLPVQTSAGVPSLAYLQRPSTAPYMTAETIANFAMGFQAIEQNEPQYLAFWGRWWSLNRTGLGF